MTASASEVSQVRHRGLADAYQLSAHALDEVLFPGGAVRPHWKPLLEMLDELGPGELVARWERARRLIRENGITHNVYDDPGGEARPWNLDLLPLVVSGSEWANVSEGLTQRATLLNTVIADLYGPARSITEGLVPPELIYANPGFLRACHGITPPRGKWLHLYAADLTRGDNGQFHVLSDRTQAPSGAGYSLENRIVLSSVLPTIFSQCNVVRMASFFISLRQSLTALAPPSRENPRVLLLTPGPYNETYFEHAYLARYLGYTLVQGNDLTVRDCRVYLKTLSGLQRVDVILRRVDDTYCDPLELYQDSFLGVPGLLQAVREGTVAVANALGSGVMQGSAFLPFLPALCRRFLSEELKLPSVHTWWCGDDDARRYVLDNLPRLVVKSAFAAVRHGPIFGSELTRDQLAAVRGHIEARPMNFVAQEQLSPYRVPVLLNGEVQPRRFVVRSFLSATDDGFDVLPGGLTRVTAGADALVVSLQKGGGSKDTWVLSDSPVGQMTLLTPATAPLKLSRVGGDLPSRIADDLFWLGRYVQRAEGVSRLARCVFSRLSDPNTAESPLAISILMRVLAGNAAPRPGPDTARKLANVMFSPADPSGLLAAVKAFHSLARILRDRISLDAWRILQALQREVSEFSGDISDDQVTRVLELLHRLVTGFLAFEGMAAESMTRGQPWRFLDMGMRIERGISMARLVRAALVHQTRDEAFLLDAILEIADSSLTYRRRYFTRLEPTAAVDLLIADDGNPRGIAFQAALIEKHLSALPRETDHPHRSPDLQLAIELRTMLRLEDLSMACRPADTKRHRLDEILTTTDSLLSLISDFVSQIFFTHAAGRPHQLAQQPDRLP